MPHQKSLPHFHPLPGLRNSPRLAGLLRAAFALAAPLVGPRLRAADTWDPVPPALLAETAPQVDPDAPAEAVFRRIYVDDDDFPDNRIVREYTRYKIFDPAKAADVTRISQVQVKVEGADISGDFEIHARLTLPNGTSTEFGRESVRQRSLAQFGGRSWWERMGEEDSAELNEKFLAVTGVEAGAVLDIRISHRNYGVMNTGFAVRMLLNTPINEVLQGAYPIRELTYRQRLATYNEYVPRPFLLNAQGLGARLDGDKKKRMVTVTAHRLPALVPEPFRGPVRDYALTYLCAYSERHANFITHHIHDEHTYIEADWGPWAALASRTYLFERDMARPSGQLRKLATLLTAGARSDADKAAFIHNYVHNLYRRSLQNPRARHLINTPMTDVDSIEDLLEAENHPDYRIPPLDYTWLGLTLYRLSGLQADAVLLPNRNMAEFSERLVADMFLPNIAVRVKTGGNWQYSLLASPAPIAFGSVPWTMCGEGLVVHDGKQEFVAVETTAAEQSTVVNSGKFELRADGVLSGDCRRTLNGQPAWAIRNRLRFAPPARQRAVWRRMLSNEFKSATVTVEGVAGVQDPAQPVVVSYHLEIPDFATATKERMLFAPSVFHRSGATFSSTVRHYPVRFPFPIRDVDEVEIRYPAGYRMESKWAPPPLAGPQISYACGMSYLPHRDIFRMKREFVCRLYGIPVADYSRFKAWYDQVDDSDQHQVVLVKTAGAHS